MSKSPETRQTLLIRLRDAEDERAWSEFVEIYAPLIHAYGMKHRLQDADAADLAQSVLQSVAGAVGDFNYDSSKGSFRGWLLTITRNNMLKMLNKRSRSPVGSGDTSCQQLLAQHPDSADDEEIWNAEHDKALFRWAVKQVRPDFTEVTWNAFWQTAVEGKRPADVAKSFDMSLGAVYIAKSRVTKRIREVIQSIEQE